MLHCHIWLEYSAFGGHYIVGHFLWLARGRKLQKDLRKRHRSPLVIALNVPLCSLDANISVIRTIASDKGQEWH